MTAVFTDASSAILLYRAGLFEVTARTFSLVMAGAVYEEVTRKDYPGAGLFRCLARAGQVTVSPEKPDFKHCKYKKGWPAMHRGEQETIALCLQPEEDAGSFVLMDDGQGARFCARHQLPFINALLVPKIFWYSGLMTETEAGKNMEKLSKTGRYSPSILARAQSLTRKDLAFFLAGEGDGD